MYLVQGSPLQETGIFGCLNTRKNNYNTPIKKKNIFRSTSYLRKYLSIQLKTDNERYNNIIISNSIMFIVYNKLPYTYINFSKIIFLRNNCCKNKIIQVLAFEY